MQLHTCGPEVYAVAAGMVLAPTDGVGPDWSRGVVVHIMHHMLWSWHWHCERARNLSCPRVCMKPHHSLQEAHRRCAQALAPQAVGAVQEEMQRIIQEVTQEVMQDVMQERREAIARKEASVAAMVYGGGEDTEDTEDTEDIAPAGCGGCDASTMAAGAPLPLSSWVACRGM